MEQREKVCGNTNGSDREKENPLSENEYVELWSMIQKPKLSSSEIKEIEEIRRKCGYNEDDPEYQFMSAAIDTWMIKRKLKRLKNRVAKRDQKGLRRLNKAYGNKSGVRITSSELYALFQEKRPFYLILRIGNEIREVGYRYASTMFSKYFDRYYCAKQHIDKWYNGLPYWDNPEELMNHLEELSDGQNVFELLKFNTMKTEQCNWQKGYFGTIEPEKKDYGELVNTLFRRWKETVLALLIYVILNTKVITYAARFLMQWIDSGITQSIMYKAEYIIVEVVLPIILMFIVIFILAGHYVHCICDVIKYFSDKSKMKKTENWIYYQPEYVNEKMRSGNRTTVMYRGKRIHVGHYWAASRLEFTSIPRSFIDSSPAIKDTDWDRTSEYYKIGDQIFFFREDFLRGLQTMDEGLGLCCYDLHDPFFGPRF